MKNYAKKSGFTLIELLVVMTIIVLISVVGILNFREASKSARDGRRKVDLETVRQALVLYKAQNGVYPTTGVIGVNNGNYNTIAGILSTSTSKYLSNPVPVDPLNDATYNYAYGGSITSFCLCVQVENTNNANSAAACWSGSTHYCVNNP